MLKIINDLQPFFEDNYRRINVREYGKLVKISPPTASKLLSYYKKEGLLLMEEYKNYMLFYANKENKLFIELSKIYWRLRLKEFIEHIEKKLITQTIILFGSTSKGEIKEDSDIDIAIIGIKKDIDIKNFEARIKRKIQILWFKSMEEVKNNELKNSIINGVTLSGRLRL
ncbi:nucleotidyltransferase domain-containing protein [Candidatus Woesearchaeota archaeon]|nr:nucleotidyltransferase domain-containing protein [Candidatus Woesearchaeota archaeon]